MRGWGGRREGSGRLKTLDPAELQAYARQRMSRARAAQFLGTSWAVVDREARRYGITFPSPRRYRGGYPRLCGARNGRAKLTPSQVRAILASPLPPQVLADRHRVARSTISDIRNGVSWVERRVG